MWPLRIYNILPQYLTTSKICWKKKKNTEYKKCFDFLYKFCPKHICQKNSARYSHKCTKFFMQSTRYSCQILKKFGFSHRFSKNTQISNCMKIRPVGADLFHARTDGRRQTDMTKLINAFGNFSNKLNEIKRFWNYWRNPKVRSSVTWQLSCSTKKNEEIMPTRLLQSGHTCPTRGHWLRGQNVVLQPLRLPIS